MTVSQQVSRSLIWPFIAAGLSLAVVACGNGSNSQSGGLPKKDVEITKSCP
jgi:hypothetical protein